MLRFLERLRAIKRFIVERDEFLVVGHHDADGITSCAIVLSALRRLGKEANYVILRQLDSKSIESIEGLGNPVFVDLGSGQLSLLERKLRDGFVIFDHHVPERDHELQLNPHTFGYDGARDISAAGVAYLFAKSFGFLDLAPIAVVGAVGDVQDADGKLKSLNKVAVEDGKREGLLRVEKDLRLFGRESRPLAYMLLYASEPVLPGITGDLRACYDFLRRVGVKLKEGGKWRNYSSLSREEKQKLMTALYIHLLDEGVPEEAIWGMVGDVYTLLEEKAGSELRDAKEFASLLNACGRQGEPEVGVEVCLGERGGVLDRARKILARHRRELCLSLKALREVGVVSKKAFYCFDARGLIRDRIVGTVAGMSYSALMLEAKKPVVALAEDSEEEGWIKVSARGTWSLVRRGLHLGKALRKSSERVGGEGGGHSIAAGARVPEERLEEFLACLDELIGEQLLGQGSE